MDSGGSVTGAVRLAAPPLPAYLAAVAPTAGSSAAPMSPVATGRQQLPPPPPPPPPPPKPSTGTTGTGEGQGKVYRYRSLRGKSVSSPQRKKKLHVFADADAGDDVDGSGPGRSRVQTSPTRRRSKSTASIMMGMRNRYNYHADPAADNPKLGDAKEADPGTTALDSKPWPGQLKLSRTTTTTAAAAAFTSTSTHPTTNLPLKPRSPNISSTSPSPSPSHSATHANLKPLEGFKTVDLQRLKEAKARAQRMNKPHAGGLDQLQDGHDQRHHYYDHGHGREPKDREEAALWADEVARLEAETDRILAEQKKRDLARLQAQLALTPTPTSSPKPKPKRLILETFPFLAKKSANGSSLPTTPKSAPAKTFAFPIWSPTLSLGDKSPSPAAMSFIEYGGGGVVPQTDAPASAVNGGERVSRDPLDKTHAQVESS